MKRLTQEEYINKCNEVHNNRYDYSLVEYTNLRNKVNIICKSHGDFEQISKNHKDGQGCPICSGRILLNKQEYIKIASDIHNHNFDYSLLNDGHIKADDYISIINIENKLIYSQLSDHHRNGIKPTKICSKSLIDKLKIIHNNSFEYEITSDYVGSTSKILLINKLTGDKNLYRVDRHLQGMCPNKVTLNYFLYKSSEIHKDKYDYSLVSKIKGNSDKVKIICKEHGIFEQRVSNHINLVDGCPKCVGVGKWNTKLVIDEFKKVHLDNFDYSLVIFEKIDKKVKIICKEHGIFEQKIHKHLKGQGCQFCSTTSKGEDFIKTHLDDMKIKYIRQHSFDTCKFINKLSFDFYLPDYNICIEFDGEQHFKPIKWFGGQKGYELNIKRDNVKNKWCIENNVDLLRIKYNEVDKIQNILKEQLLLVV